MNYIEIEQKQMILKGLHAFSKHNVKHVKFNKKIILLNENIKNISQKRYFYEYEKSNGGINKSILHVIEFEFIGNELPIEFYFKDEDKFNKKWNEIKRKLK